MNRITLHRTLAVVVAAVAVLNGLSGLSMPVAERKAPVLLVVAWMVLMLVHACVYELGDRIRSRFGLSAYAAAQAVILFAIALAQPPPPLTVALYVAAVAELITLAGSIWGSAWITISAVALLVLASFITSDLYRAATSGLILAATGLLAHAVAGLLHRPPKAEPRAVPINAQNGAALSAREVEVLRELVSGVRNTDISAKLRISERTVKAHLGSIYQKLGVASRAAAVAAAVRLKLV